MMKFVSIVLLCCSSLWAGENKFPSVPAEMLKSSHRLVSSKSTKEGTVITSHGSAVAVDLKKQGLEGKRFLLTAAHCAVENGKALPCLVEVMKDGKKTWVETKLIAYDSDSDIALLYAEEDMPTTAILADVDSLDLGDALFAIGGPHGRPMTATLGYLSDKGAPADTYAHSRWYQGSMSITHGNTGGPVFDANKGEVVGIVTAVIGAPREAPNVALFIGAPDINNFLTANSEKIQKFLKKRR